MTVPPSDFEEIAHTGGRISFIHEAGKGTAVQISHSIPRPAVIYQVCISLNGELLGFAPIGGIGRVIPYPQPSVLAYLISDSEGFFGSLCRACNSYFRTDRPASVRLCPYCAIGRRPIEFLTENQITFLTNFFNEFWDAHESKKTRTIDLDELCKNLPANKQGWVYSEERQQSKHTYPKCRCVYDILGDYALCPACGKANLEEVFLKKYADFEKRLGEVDVGVNDRHDREVEWEKLTRIISEFEALADRTRAFLLTFPHTPKRRQDLSQLGFLRLVNADKCLEQWFGFQLLNGMNEDDKTFLNVMFNRRHLFVHKAGRVDQEYLDNTGDTSVRLHQVIRFRSKEVKRLLPLVRSCALNLVHDFERLK